MEDGSGIPTGSNLNPCSGANSGFEDTTPWLARESSRNSHARSYKQDSLFPLPLSIRSPQRQPHTGDYTIM
jgi:hypothetical protein